MPWHRTRERQACRPWSGRAGIHHPYEGRGIPASSRLLADYLCRTAGAQAMGILCRSGSSIIPDKGYRMRYGHEHERHHDRPGSARTAVSVGACRSRNPVGSGSRSSIPVRRAVDPGRHRLLPQVTLTGKE